MVLATCARAHTSQRRLGFVLTNRRGMRRGPSTEAVNEVGEFREGLIELKEQDLRGGWRGRAVSKRRSSHPSSRSTPLIDRRHYQYSRSGWGPPLSGAGRGLFRRPRSAHRRVALGRGEYLADGASSPRSVRNPASVGCAIGMPNASAGEKEKPGAPGRTGKNRRALADLDGRVETGDEVPTRSREATASTV